MTVLVKICGITRLEDALSAVEAGADALGFNFYPKSPRFIDRERAAAIIAEIPPSIHKVGVFVNADLEDVVDLAIDLSLDCVQFHGDESPEYCAQLARPWYKAFRLQGPEDLEQIPAYRSGGIAAGGIAAGGIAGDMPWIMIDAHSEKARGGTGERANWALAGNAKRFGKLILAGGLTEKNVEDALKIVAPDAVDVASGVESRPGIKDAEKMLRFIEKVKKS